MLQLALLLLLLVVAPAQAAPLGENAAHLLDVDPAMRGHAIVALGESGDRGAVAPLIQARFWLDERDQRAIDAALAALTGVRRDSWADWQVWEQEQAALTPFAGYDGWLAAVLARVDPGFRRFVRPGMAHRIRLEEIVWGGVRVDGIPALDDPKVTAADAAGWLGDDDLVFGVAIGGQERAYPQRIVDWHEMVNDTVGAVPVSLAYCTLCGAAILFDGRAAADPPFRFGSSGLLYRSNKLMYDRRTDSLWNQFTGEPVAGALADSGVVLPILPVVTTRWATWRHLHPATTVLALQTGFARDYRPGAAYGSYFASPELMFPAAVADPAHQKRLAFGIRVPGGVRAWPLERFDGGAVLNETVGLLRVVLIGDAAERTVRAYEREAHVFAASGPGRLVAEGQGWTVTEAALAGPNGQSLRRLPGHVGYRFAWDGYFGVGVEAR